MADEPEPGDEVAWGSSGGSSEGMMVGKPTSASRIKRHVAKPTPEDPAVSGPERQNRQRCGSQA